MKAEAQMTSEFREHVSVLKHEVLEAFKGLEINSFFDGTLGAGGHAEAILRDHPEIECYIGCDKDPRAFEISTKRLGDFGSKIKWLSGSFTQVKSFNHLDGFLIDIGVSSMQLDEKGRGFSFRVDDPLDMRMDPTQSLTAEEIVNRWSQKDLEKIFWEYGEERQSRRAAEAIVISRRKKPILTTKQLVDVVTPVVKWGRLHPATLVFQALRIAVNAELEELKEGVLGAINSLNVGGRLAVITFHSLEDRIVKHLLKENEKVKVLTKKPIIPKLEECKKNSRARSSKLRIAEKIC
jgi:16S rRNA (cytosine1402-N4)-methyltransferase